MPSQPSDLILTHAFLIDGTGVPPIPDATLVLRNGRVLTIAKDGFCVGDGTQQIDLQGRTVVPGFFNVHVHQAFKEATLRAWAQGGVTTVRDLGSSLRVDQFAHRDRLNLYSRHARLIAAGPMVSAVRGYGTLHVSSAEDARIKINTLADNGAELIKIGLEDSLKFRHHNMLKPEEIRAIVETAHARGLPVSAHVTKSRNLALAIEGGVDDIAHMVIDPLSDELLEKMISRQIAWVPTLELWSGVSRLYQLNWDVQAKENLHKFVQAGGLVALGTDYAGHGCPFDLGMPITEMKLMNAAGMSPMQVIQAGTRNAARVCRVEHELGTLEPGKIADLVILDGNPIEDLNALLRIFAIFHRGQRISSVK